MVTELLVPRRRLVVPKPPGRIKLDMAFGVGAGTTLFDKSRYRSHGAITGADWAAGVHGYCLDFVAANLDYVEIPSTETQLNFTSEDFSMIARVKMDDISNYPIIFIRGDTNTKGYHWIIYAIGSVFFYTYQATDQQYSRSADGEIITGTWYTLGISRDGASVKLYKNGVDVTSVAYAHIDPVTYVGSALIGIRDTKLSLAFDGKIEFLRVFGGIALSTSEHLAYHNALA